MTPSSLDLNLLVALDALLQERSVTLAAQRLGLTQPTLSASLARLRRHFNDQLLYRSGNSYYLTPLAVHLASRTTVALDGVRRIFASQPTVDPATSTREFTVVCSDYTAAVVGSALSVVLAREAPHTRIHFQQTNPGPFTSEEDRLRAVDGVLLPHGFLTGIPHQDLFRDRWVCIVASDNDTVGETLTMDDLSRLPWVTTFDGSRSAFQTTAMRQLTQLGGRVRIQAVVNSFLAVPFMVAGTDRIALVQERLATLVARFAGIRVLDCPFEATPLVEAFWWHPDFDRDAEHIWFRERVAAVGTQFGLAA